MSFPDQLIEHAFRLGIRTAKRSQEDIVRSLVNNKLRLLRLGVRSGEQSIAPVSICNFVDAEFPSLKLSHTLRNLADRWERYSFNERYPVPGGKDSQGRKLEAPYAYAVCSADNNFWTHPEVKEHCTARAEYLDFLILATNHKVITIP